MSERADDRRETRGRGETANEQFKRESRKRLWVGLAAAVGIHTALYLIGPALNVKAGEPVGDETAGLEAVRLLPEVEIPEPPAPIEQPPVPRVEAPELAFDAEDLAIEPVKFPEEVEVGEVPPVPSTASKASDAMQGYRHWGPSMVRPKLENPDEVRRALERRYPRHLINAGVTGRVVMLFWIDEEGEVQKYEIQQSSGNAELDRAAEDVVETMEFRPAVRNGQPEKVIVALPITFRIP